MAEQDTLPALPVAVTMLSRGPVSKVVRSIVAISPVLSVPIGLPASVPKASVTSVLSTVASPVCYCVSECDFSTTSLTIKGYQCQAAENIADFKRFRARCMEGIIFDTTAID